jgi:aryl-alcohol dehydrogenase-like predicted oxidoreductase
MGTGHGAVVRGPLGTTGVEVSRIGIGGFHIGKMDDRDEAIAMIRRALDAGMDFLDNSWDYHEGESERRMGEALTDGYRDKAFVMTKLDSRTAGGARRQFEESLERLGVETIDLVQIHEVIRESDSEAVFADGGAIEALVAARDEGLLRYIGFTGHKDPLVHLRMIRTSIAHGFHFDTAQMPISAMDANYRSFLHTVVPLCEEQGSGSSP